MRLDERLTHQVFQLSDIARKVQPPERLQIFGPNRGQRTGTKGAILFEKMSDQRREIIGPLAQRPAPQLRGHSAGEKDPRESSLRAPFFELSIRRGYHSYAHLDLAIFAHAQHPVFFQHAQ